MRVVNQTSLIISPFNSTSIWGGRHRIYSPFNHFHIKAKDDQNVLKGKFTIPIIFGIVEQMIFGIVQQSVLELLNPPEKLWTQQMNFQNENNVWA